MLINREFTDVYGNSYLIRLIVILFYATFFFTFFYNNARNDIWR